VQLGRRSREAAKRDVSAAADDEEGDHVNGGGVARETPHNHVHINRHDCAASSFIEIDEKESLTRITVQRTCSEAGKRTGRQAGRWAARHAG
jgi:hypothetical protein